MDSRIAIHYCIHISHTLHINFTSYPHYYFYVFPFNSHAVYFPSYSFGWFR